MMPWAEICIPQRTYNKWINLCFILIICRHEAFLMNFEVMLWINCQVFPFVVLVNFVIVIWANKGIFYKIYLNFYLLVRRVMIHQKNDRKIKCVVLFFYVSLIHLCEVKSQLSCYVSFGASRPCEIILEIVRNFTILTREVKPLWLMLSKVGWLLQFLEAIHCGGGLEEIQTCS